MSNKKKLSSKEEFNIKSFKVKRKFIFLRKKSRKNNEFSTKIKEVLKSSVFLYLFLNNYILIIFYFLKSRRSHECIYKKKRIVVVITIVLRKLIYYIKRNVLNLNKIISLI